jgi:hypothetical protein
MKPLVSIASRNGISGAPQLTNIHNLRMLHDILVHRDRGDPEEKSAKDHSNDTRNPTEDTKDNTPVSFIK